MRAVFLSCLCLSLAAFSPLATSQECSSAYTACQRHCAGIPSKAQRVACKSECVAQKTACKTGRWFERTGDAIGDFLSDVDSGDKDTQADQ
jgi:hypothetical protein